MTHPDAEPRGDAEARRPARRSLIMAGLGTLIAGVLAKVKPASARDGQLVHNMDGDLVHLGESHVQQSTLSIHREGATRAVSVHLSNETGPALAGRAMSGSGIVGLSGPFPFDADAASDAYGVAGFGEEGGVVGITPGSRYEGATLPAAGVLARSLDEAVPALIAENRLGISAELIGTLLYSEVVRVHVPAHVQSFHVPRPRVTPATVALATVRGDPGPNRVLQWLAIRPHEGVDLNFTNPTLAPVDVDLLFLEGGQGPH